MGDLFERHFQAGAAFVEQPAVVIAAQALVFEDAVGEVGAAVRAVRIDEAVGAALVFVEDQVFAHQTDGLDRVVIQLCHGGERHPVASQELAHERAGAGLHELLVLLFAEHLAASPELLGLKIKGLMILREMLAA